MRYGDVGRRFNHEVREGDELSKRISPVQKLPRERLVHDGDVLGTDSVLVRKITAHDDRDTKRPEPLCRNHVAEDEAFALGQSSAIRDIDRRSECEILDPESRTTATLLATPGTVRSFLSDSFIRSDALEWITDRRRPSIGASSTRSRVKPGSRDARDTNVRTKSPAPTSRTSDNAIWTTTRAPGIQPEVATSPRLCSFSASMGETAVARTAGVTPKTRIAIVATRLENVTSRQSTAKSKLIGTFCVDSCWTTRALAQAAIRTPAAEARMATTPSRREVDVSTAIWTHRAPVAR